MFVRAPAGEFAYYGVGKLIERNGEECTVEYFDAPTTEPIIVQFETAEIVRVTIPEQTRIYTFNRAIGAWEIGRLLDDHGDKQLVRFPNKSTRFLDAADVFVRWSKPIADPTPFLANRINESPRFSDGRSAFVRSQLAQRSASLGMSAILSSSVELENHQVEVVRRVLQDPVQRYLLADEVGLGKTIEAGMLIRQCRLDRGDEACILVLVPETLAKQWEAELTQKFHLGALLGRQLHVVTAPQAKQWQHLLAEADMLVIDEAHHLTHGGVQADLYGLIAAAAPSIERVLLLSATPALHNERGFLAMLHLLDPETYKLDGFEDFRKRIESRQSLAEIVGGLVPENALYLDYTIDALRDLFPDDAILQDHAAKLRALVETMPAEDDPDLVDAIGRTRAHLSEVYRLHRRILRHRRRNVVGLTPDRAGVTLVSYACDERAALVQAIDDWRFKEAIDCAGADEEVWSARYSTFRQVLEQGALYPVSGSGTVAFLAQRGALSGDAASFAEIVKGLNRKGLFERRAAALCEALRAPINDKCKCVVFCSDRPSADRLTELLRAELQISIDRHDPEGEDWADFNDDPTRLVLICDRRAEEGLNLQGGRKILVHFDLPFNPNRIEQRLGRVDRYGSGQSVPSIVIVCHDDPVERAWANYLDGALRLFDRSVASLQYLIEESVRDLIPALFNEGAEAVERLMQSDGGDNGRIEREIKAIDQQDALDSLGDPPSDLVDALCEIDDRWREIESDTRIWLEDTLLFDRLHDGGRAEDISGAPFRYQYATERRHTLLPLPTFMAAAEQSLDLAPDPRFGRRVKTVPFTFSRRTALSKKGREASARLLRYGEPFLTAIGTITNADDRGRSFALWREDQTYSASQTADPYLRFDFLIDVDLSHVETILDRFGHNKEAGLLALRRRGDFALAPAFSTIWLDASLEPIGDGPLREKLERPYAPDAKDPARCDINVNARRWQQLNRLGINEVDHWDDYCTKGRAAAEAVLLAHEDLKARLRFAERDAATLDSGRLSQLETRLRHTPSKNQDQLIFERELAAALRQGIANPRVRLETIGAIFLTGSRAATERLTGGL